jgi:hypothetical protein
MKKERQTILYGYLTAVVIIFALCGTLLSRGDGDPKPASHFLFGFAVIGFLHLLAVIHQTEYRAKSKKPVRGVKSLDSTRSESPV